MVVGDSIPPREREEEEEDGFGLDSHARQCGKTVSSHNTPPPSLVRREADTAEEAVK